MAYVVDYSYPIFFMTLIFRKSYDLYAVGGGGCTENFWNHSGGNFGDENKILKACLRT